MARTKKIFISDIHLMDERSFDTQPGYNHPYYWISEDRIKLLAKFLEAEVINKDDVKELIILGDFLDNWVCPIALTPASFQQIIDAPKNQPAITKLKQIANGGNVVLSYVPGNHDLMVETATLVQNFPGIRVLGDGTKPYVGVYKQDGIAAEHSNQYDFFCAPNPNPACLKGHILPIGYFLSRFGAEKKVQQGGKPNVWDILGHFLKKLDQSDSSFIKKVILSVGEECGLKNDSKIIMNGRDNFGPSITLMEVADLYADAMTCWNKIKPNGLTALEAIHALASLRITACYAHFGGGTERIAIFGHSHDVKLLGMNREGSYYTTYDQNGSDFLYANSGSWTDKYDCTYIETRISGKTRHYVDFYEYEASGKRKFKKSRYIYLQ